MSHSCILQLNFIKQRCFINTGAAYGQQNRLGKYTTSNTLYSFVIVAAIATSCTLLLQCSPLSSCSELTLPPDRLNSIPCLQHCHVVPRVCISALILWPCEQCRIVVSTLTILRCLHALLHTVLQSELHNNSKQSEVSAHARPRSYGL